VAGRSRLSLSDGVCCLREEAEGRRNIHKHFWDPLLEGRAAAVPQPAQLEAVAPVFTRRPACPRAGLHTRALVVTAGRAPARQAGTRREPTGRGKMNHLGLGAVGRARGAGGLG